MSSPTSRLQSPCPGGLFHCDCTSMRNFVKGARAGVIEISGDPRTFFKGHSGVTTDVFCRVWGYAATGRGLMPW